MSVISVSGAGPLLLAIVESKDVDRPRAPQPRPARLGGRSHPAHDAQEREGGGPAALRRGLCTLGRGGTATASAKAVQAQDGAAAASQPNASQQPAAAARPCLPGTVPSVVARRYARLDGLVVRALLLLQSVDRHFQLQPPPRSRVQRPRRWRRPPYSPPLPRPPAGHHRQPRQPSLPRQTSEG